MDTRLLTENLKSYLDLPTEELRTLDPSHYTSKAMYELEVEQLFKKE